MNEPQYVYRVVHLDGRQAYTGRGSDPFTNLGSARRRRSTLNNDYGYDNNHPDRFVVERSVVNWERFDG